MPRILAIDYGSKRTGLAVTDPLQIIATALDTVESAQLMAYLKKYFEKEPVSEVIIGLPKTLNNTDSSNAEAVRGFIAQFKNNFPTISIHTIDERFTSSIAQQAMISGGMKKKDRQVKGNVDKISAVLILQDYLLQKK
ncbi:MAG: Putative pre-16S rRNA nuclease YqgF [Cytophagales bacterium]|jgi:putative Holliday junction resolvase|nr:Holliday junction resolvase RuvX [Bacteroidota bacterium]MBS1980398.1 Holliday junction resolvase RuvX [Bacteroidota bacterium]WHZ07712.1 MAG: Putative pre-16S rRNA nuclease YqgF [Cytophagales bacterium]